MREWIEKLFADPEMAGMGHGQTVEDANLGLGWIYYGLARTLRPSYAVVIGSLRGFVPLVIGKALQDNGSGEVIFIDPSYVDEFWCDPKTVQAHFARYGLDNVSHYQLTTQEFALSERYASLSDVGMLFVDGYHSQEQARLDHETFLPKMTDQAVALFHDSVRERRTRIYGDDRAYIHTVCHYMDQLREDDRYEVAALPQSDGITIVKQRTPSGVLSAC